MSARHERRDTFLTFHSAQLPEPTGRPPQRWRPRSTLVEAPLSSWVRWAERAGHTYPISLGGERCLVSLSASLWVNLAPEREALRATSEMERALSPSMLGAPPTEEDYQWLPEGLRAEAINALSKCVAVHVAEELETGGRPALLNERWEELCRWASHVALLQFDLKLSTPITHKHRASLEALSEAWSEPTAPLARRTPSARRWRAALNNLKASPHLATLGEELGRRLSVTHQLSLDLSALGQWFWCYCAQDPTLLSAVRAEVTHALKERPYHPTLIKSLPTLTSTLLELTRLTPTLSWLTLPLSALPLSALPDTSPLSPLSPLLANKHMRRAQQLILSPLWLHRDEALWSEPHRFDPRRFLSLALSGLEAPPPAHFLPFGLAHPTKSARAQLTLHALIALITGVLRRGVYQLAPISEHEGGGADKGEAEGGVRVYAGSITPLPPLEARFVEAEGLGYVRSTRL